METAKELFDRMLEENDECTSTEMMIEFAKLHVEQALKAAHRNAQFPEEDLDYTLRAYPLTEIK